MPPLTSRTTCTRDCPDACGILVSRDSEGRPVLKGDPQHPVTRGFLCFRTSRFPDLLDHPDRLRGPLLRKNGVLTPVGMEEALDVAADRLGAIVAESGPKAVFHYRSGGSLGLLKGLADRFFEELGPCATKIGDICSGAGEAAQELDFGVCDSNALADLENARSILLWGKNPKVSNVHLMPVLKRAQARGARLVLIDPVRHKTAHAVDEVVCPAPGRDPELAFGIARQLFESGAVSAEAMAACDHVDGFKALAMGRTVAEWAAAAGVTVETMESLARALAEGPTAILIGWGMQRRGRGGATVRLMDALSVLSGNLFRSGGGASFYFARRKPFHGLNRGPEIAPRTIREPLFAADVAAAVNPKVRGIWVTAGNPVAMLPDSKAVAKVFEETEFTVVVDPFLTDTGRRASLVLPCPTMLEDDDLVGAYGHHYLGAVRPVLERLPGVMHEVELFQALADRLGLDGFPRDDLRTLQENMLEGVSLADVEAGAVQSPAATPLLFPEGTVCTPNGKVQLIDQWPGDPVPDSEGLWLFSNSTEKSQASVWSGKGLTDYAPVTVHPDAAPTGSQAGDLVEVVSSQARLQARLVLDSTLRTDLALMPKGGHFDKGHAANVLIPARATDLGLGAAYLDCRVTLQKLSSPSAGEGGP